MTVLFVTGTDTEVGKTVVTAALAAVQLSLGRTVAVVKPAQTGVAPDEDGDLAEVRRLAGDVATYEGVRLPDPLAPDTAARVAGLELPGLAEQRGLIDRVASAHDATLVEGAGGVLVNLGENWNLIDLADSVRYAGHQVVFVVVARAGLGTLNHAGLTVQAIQARALEVAGVVVGCLARSARSGRGAEPAGPAAGHGRPGARQGPGGCRRVAGPRVPPWCPRLGPRNLTDI